MKKKKHEEGSQRKRKRLLLQHQILTQPLIPVKRDSRKCVERESKCKIEMSFSRFIDCNQIATENEGPFILKVSIDFQGNFLWKEERASSGSETNVGNIYQRWRRRMSRELSSVQIHCQK